MHICHSWRLWKTNPKRDCNNRVIHGKWTGGLCKCGKWYGAPFWRWDRRDWWFHCIHMNLTVRKLKKLYPPIETAIREATCRVFGHKWEYELYGSSLRSFKKLKSKGGDICNRCYTIKSQ